MMNLGSLTIIIIAFMVAPATAQILSVNNGGPWGDWGSWDHCRAGQRAIGYRQKIEGSQGGGDDTALNAIELLCTGLHSITSSAGPWGSWDSYAGKICPKGEYLVAFALQVERPISGDDTAANYVKFQCSGGKVIGTRGRWGDYGNWSRCNNGRAICGMITKVEGRQGSGDDTALNDVWFLCCDQQDK